MTGVRGAARELVDLLLPARCPGCRRRLVPEESAGRICLPCRSRLRAPPHPRCRRCHFPLGTGRGASDGCLACEAWPPAVRAARFAALLEPPADAFVHALKYEGWPDLAPPMAARMAAVELDPEVRDGGLVVPVPTTRRRRRRRGYNQAALLARALADRVGLPVVDALARAGDARTQVALHPAERRANVRDAFRPTPAAGRVAGAPVLLVDDVLTTGATVSAAAEALERAGASGVWVVAFARSVPRLSPEAP